MCVCVCVSESEIEEFTSLSSASIHLLLHFSSRPHVTSRALSRFRMAGRIGRISWPLIFLSAVYPVHPLPRGFNVHAKQTAAPARLSIIRYIRLWPSNPSLTTPQTWRKREKEGEGGRRKMGNASPGLAPRSTENSRDYEDRETMSATTTKRTELKRDATKTRREMETRRIFPGIVFGIPMFLHRLRKTPPFVFFCILKRANSNSVCVISSPPNVSELQMRGPMKDVGRRRGGSIEIKQGANSVVRVLKYI